MQAQYLYRRALETLLQVESLRASCRSVYDYRRSPVATRCVVERRYVSYVAPDRIRHTFVHVDGVLDREESDVVQVGALAYRRHPPGADGDWVEREPVLKTPEDLLAVISGWLDLPSTHDWAGGAFSTTAFHIPVRTTMRIEGRDRYVILLPVEIQQHPQIYWPGDKIPGGPGPRLVRHGGSRLQPARVTDEGRMVVDALTARPLRYLSTVTATMDDGASLVLRRSHVRFRYDVVASIDLPPQSEAAARLQARDGSDTGLAPVRETQ